MRARRPMIPAASIPVRPARRLLALGVALLALLGTVLLGTALGAPVLEGRTLRYEDGPQLVWTRNYPAALGDLSGPLEVAGVTYLGVGPVVYAIGSAGNVLGRADLPGVVTSLDSSGGVVRVTTQYRAYTEQFTLGGQGGAVSVQERVVFPPDPAITEWLARAADATPQAALAQAAQDDPTNAFVALRQARLANQQGDQYRALNAVRRALSDTMPFPAWVQLAARLDTAGFPAAADLALDRARRDAAARGLDPEIPISRAALGSYGNPSGYVGTLLAQNRLSRAEVWMNHLRELHPRFEGGPALYARYAELLETQGRAGEAEEWRQFTRSLSAGTLYNLGPDGLRSVRDAARLSTLSAGLALGAALLALLLRAWPAQGLALRELGGRYRSWLRQPLSRARRVFLAYTSGSERLMLTLLSAALIALIGGWQWVGHASSALRSPPLNMGTYGGGWNSAELTDLNLRAVPDTALLSGISAQLDGDESLAREHYTRAVPDACALNNLGVIAQARGDEPQARDHYRAALSARPDLAAAAFNLGLAPNTPGIAFQRTYRPNQPRLCYPDQRSLTRATTGDLSATLGKTLREPWQLLEASPGSSLRLNWLLLAATLLAAMLALTLLLPRTPLPTGLARPPLYRLAGALLPGSALLAQPWGGMLLLVWASALAALTPNLRLLGAPLLSVPHLPTLTQPGIRNVLLAALILTYLLNTLALITAELRHARQRKRDAQQGA